MSYQSQAEGFNTQYKNQNIQKQQELNDSLVQNAMSLGVNISSAFINDSVNKALNDMRSDLSERSATNKFYLDKDGNPVTDTEQIKANYNEWVKERLDSVNVFIRSKVERNWKQSDSSYFGSILSNGIKFLDSQRLALASESYKTALVSNYDGSDIEESSNIILSGTDYDASMFFSDEHCDSISEVANATGLPTTVFLRELQYAKELKDYGYEDYQIRQEIQSRNTDFAIGYFLDISNGAFADVLKGDMNTNKFLGDISSFISENEIPGLGRVMTRDEQTSFMENLRQDASQMLSAYTAEQTEILYSKIYPAIQALEDEGLAWGNKEWNELAESNSFNINSISYDERMMLKYKLDRNDIVNKVSEYIDRVSYAKTPEEASNILSEALHSITDDDIEILNGFFKISNAGSLAITSPNSFISFLKENAIGLSDKDSDMLDYMYTTDTDGNITLKDSSVFVEENRQPIGFNTDSIDRNSIENKQNELLTSWATDDFYTNSEVNFQYVYAGTQEGAIMRSALTANILQELQDEYLSILQDGRSPEDAFSLIADMYGIEASDINSMAIAIFDKNQAMAQSSYDLLLNNKPTGSDRTIKDYFSDYTKVQNELAKRATSEFAIRSDYDKPYNDRHDSNFQEAMYAILTGKITDKSQLATYNGEGKQAFFEEDWNMIVDALDGKFFDILESSGIDVDSMIDSAFDTSSRPTNYEKSLVEKKMVSYLLANIQNIKNGTISQGEAREYIRSAISNGRYNDTFDMNEIDFLNNKIRIYLGEYDITDFEKNAIDMMYDETERINSGLINKDSFGYSGAIEIINTKYTTMEYDNLFNASDRRISSNVITLEDDDMLFTSMALSLQYAGFSAKYDPAKDKDAQKMSIMAIYEDLEPLDQKIIMSEAAALQAIAKKRNNVIARIGNYNVDINGNSMSIEAGTIETNPNGKLILTTSNGEKLDITNSNIDDTTRKIGKIYTSSYDVDAVNEGLTINQTLERVKADPSIQNLISTYETVHPGKSLQIDLDNNYHLMVTELDKESDNSNNIPSKKWIFSDSNGRKHKVSNLISRLQDDIWANHRQEYINTEIGLTKEIINKYKSETKAWDDFEQAFKEEFPSYDIVLSPKGHSLIDISFVKVR